MHVKLDGVKVTGGILPDGIYVARLVAWEEKTASSDSKIYINCEFEIQGEEYEGKKVFDRLFLTQAAMWRLKLFALALEFPQTDDASGFETEDLFRFALSKTIRLKITQNTFQNKAGQNQTNNKILEYLKEDGSLPDNESFPGDNFNPDNIPF